MKKKKREHFYKEFEKIIKRPDLSKKGRILLKRMYNSYERASIEQVIQKETSFKTKKDRYLSDTFGNGTPKLRSFFYSTAAVYRLSSKNSVVNKIADEKLGVLYCRFLNKNSHFQDGMVGKEVIEHFLKSESKIDI